MLEKYEQLFIFFIKFDFKQSLITPILLQNRAIFIYKNLK